MEVNNEALKQISELARQQVKAEGAVKSATDALEKAKKELQYVSEVLLPNAMTEAGMSEFRLESGESIEIKRDIYASIAEANWLTAKEWLQEHNLDGIIKHSVSLSFGKGEDANATEAVELLVEAGFAPADKESIHPQTLKAFVREQLANGVDLPMEVFGVHEVVKAKVSI